jgi:hypothetical protein
MEVFPCVWGCGDDDEDGGITKPLKHVPCHSQKLMQPKCLKPLKETKLRHFSLAPADIVRAFHRGVGAGKELPDWHVLAGARGAPESTIWGFCGVRPVE